MSGVLIHAGPSLDEAARRRNADFTWLGPAEAGDGLRALRRGVKAFVLIDGLFDGACAIRHNELLQLLAAGVRVIGAASMGALRAAELHPFGMEGVGRVYQAYVRGVLTGDDEVALSHGPPEYGWAALTVPLVNVRATLLEARRRGLADRTSARALLQAARRLPFSERTWSRLLDSMPPELAGFVAAGGVDLKRRDAEAALSYVRSPREGRGASAAFREAPPLTCFSIALQRHVDANP